eukprot:m.38839 g.38839  ORF g.38839 m.38839 type:complete len:483 (-) comp11213_c0_seq2:68-1516(-)
MGDSPKKKEKVKSVRRTMTKRKSTIDVLSTGQQKITMADGSTYTGEWKDQKFHGVGEFRTQDGTYYYNGHYEDGLMHGSGFLKTNAGSYDGQFENNKMHGQGKFTYATGAEYVGNFEAGERVGEGTLSFPDGSSYRGQFAVSCWLRRGGTTPALGRKQPKSRVADASLCGCCVLLRHTPLHRFVSVYFETPPPSKSDLQHGHGIFSSPDGTHYEGEWRSGKKHGTGSIRFASGNVFEGDFQNDFMHGQGTFKGTDGHLYEGGFKEGALHGQGVYKQQDGRCYDGEFSNNLRNGKGTLQYADGSEYTGGWLNDKRHGTGKLISKAPGVKFTYEGTWDNGTRHGKGLLTYDGGLKFEGQFDHGRPLEGGVFTWPDGMSTKLALETRFRRFLGPNSNPAGWETCLLKIMNFWRVNKESGKEPPAAAAEEEEEDFGFSDEEGEAATPQANSPVAAAGNEVDSDEWEEVDLDENGIPIESTARPVRR